MQARGVCEDHVTVHRWALKKIKAEAMIRKGQMGCPAGSSASSAADPFYGWAF
jgi:hypothetical protein